MLRKVIIAEDLDSVNKAVKDLLLNLDTKNVSHTQYCDEAYLKLKKAQLDNDPFDLLICDLNFKPDHRNEKLNSGEELAKVLRKEIPDLKIIINTVEDHPNVVKRIWNSNIADAYVIKDRNGLKNLEAAIKKVAHGEKFLSPSIERSLSTNNIIELNDYEMSILKYISRGYNQDEIHEIFKKDNISPFSKSSIEKKLKDLRESFDARTNPQLVSIVKDLHLI